MPEHPRRIQLRRTAGWRKPEGAVVVARPSRWGNIYEVGSQLQVAGYSSGPHVGRYDPDDRRLFEVDPPPLLDAQMAVDLYRDDLLDLLGDEGPEVVEVRSALAELRGKDLCCWCPLEAEDGSRAPCHADVLIELSNGGTI